MQLGAGVEVPSYSDEYADAAEAAACAWLIDRRVGDGWLPVPPGEERRLDAVLMRAGRVASHIGTVIAPGRMLHTYSAGAVRVDYYRRGLFRERIVGFYRHQSLA
jgi:cell wall-associated NlpC family hydrolase